ncbi:MAG: pyridoxal phosphate-dependent aminotransferase [Eubacterium aggregans]|uniref:alanine transaminase n=1 Tax=Eubacterium aggregans TaxID=81409 RepID=A0A1H3ZZA6_9FIRM|nr:pyridoxal phosphate-dependent aminotransferase [Eubacterium aggregans]MEA5074251.1 pyridoxal phosphate-dependent aminotransferase [Eubacterium aggregans]SEA29045.1 alanine-synthesizing transaminase [Eubacterium aggregans]
MRTFRKSHKLDNVCYDIRGPVVQEASRMQREGVDIIMLNTGNPPTFDVNAPDEVIHDVRSNLRNAEGYCDSKGIFSARKAIVQYYQTKGLMDVTVDDVYIGNGTSELVQFCTQALMDDGDELLIPMPDYPLWTAAATLAGGKPVHYLCDESSDWYPDLEDIRSKINSNTKGIVIINPNNPTGAVYPKEILEEIAKIAVENDLIIFADEIYDQIIYDEVPFYPMAKITDETLVVTLNGLSKSHRVPGFRVGWMVLSGNRECARDYIEGIDILTTMRLCANVPAQHAIQTSLGGYQSIDDLVAPGGRLHQQRDIVYKRLNEIPGISCAKPNGALYAFPKIDVARFNITDDTQFALDLLKREKVLLVQGTGFNWKEPDHFRVVFLPAPMRLSETMDRLERFMANYIQA